MSKTNVKFGGIGFYFIHPLVEAEPAGLLHVPTAAISLLLLVDFFVSADKGLQLIIHIFHQVVITVITVRRRAMPRTGLDMKNIHKLYLS